MIKLIKKIWTNSPQHNLRTIIKKILGKDQFYFSLKDILISLSINKINAAQIIDRYERYKRVTNNSIKLESDIFNFENKSILEVGSGPLLGIAPLAHFHNCNEFLFYEPNFNSEIFNYFHIGSFVSLFFIELVLKLCSFSISRAHFFESPLMLLLLIKFVKGTLPLILRRP